MEDGYYALLLAIVNGVTSSKAFARINGKGGSYDKSTDEIYRKAGVSAEKAAKIFHVASSTVWRKRKNSG